MKARATRKVRKTEAGSSRRSPIPAAGQAQKDPGPSDASKYWLFKTEPGTYSYSDLESQGRTTWDGVTNNLALRNLRQIEKGNEVLIYHTGEEKAVVGLARVTRAAYPDPKSKSDKIVVVDIAPLRRLAFPVPLVAIKGRREFEDFALVRLPRLSVMPVTARQWALILEMAGDAPRGVIVA
jgi:predicted RNA-binding protein with PUA-like domain